MNNPTSSRKAELTNKDVWEIIVSLPELHEWRDIESVLFPGTTLYRPISLDWQLPAISYELLTGHRQEVVQAIGAVACAQIAIILIDDILDEEPDSIPMKIGNGRAANVAMGLQAAATLLIQQCSVSKSDQQRASLELSRMLLNTATGQALDADNLSTEADYWRVTKAKSTPFYGSGFSIGALLAGADTDTTHRFYEVGATLGEIVQICDDLEDAFAVPANPDWIQGRNNLAILYALTADHPEKMKFERLRTNCADPVVIQELQQTLISSGALSYCVYQILERRDYIYRQMGALELDCAAQLKHILDKPINPIKKLVDKILPDLTLSTFGNQ